MNPQTKVRPPTDPEAEFFQDAPASPPKPAEDPANAPHSHREEEVLVVSGAVTGAATGAIAGPPGMVAGAVIGAAVGAVIGYALDREDARKESHDAELDRDIGVTEGDLGAAPEDQPEATVGAYSSASAGGGAGSSSVSEGPLQNPETD